jgi:hypothetical protein
MYEGKSERKVPYFFMCMDVSGDEKSTSVSLDTSPLFFHVVSKLVHARVITYDIFQTLAVGDVPLPKPFLDPTPPTIQPQLDPFGVSHVWQTEETYPRLAFPSDDTGEVEVQKWLLEPCFLTSPHI